MHDLHDVALDAQPVRHGCLLSFTPARHITLQHMPICTLRHGVRIRLHDILHAIAKPQCRPRPRAVPACPCRISPSARAPTRRLPLRLCCTRLGRVALARRDDAPPRPRRLRNAMAGAGWRVRAGATSSASCATGTLLDRRGRRRAQVRDARRTREMHAPFRSRGYRIRKDSHHAPTDLSSAPPFPPPLPVAALDVLSRRQSIASVAEDDAASSGQPPRGVPCSLLRPLLRRRHARIRRHLAALRKEDLGLALRLVGDAVEVVCGGRQSAGLSCAETTTYLAAPARRRPWRCGTASRPPRRAPCRRARRRPSASCASSSCA